MPASSPVILVFDLGLTNCKSILFSADGTILARASSSYPTDHPHPGRVEQDPLDWWRAVCIATNQLWESHPSLASRVSAVSVTGHMHALVAIGRDGPSFPRAMVLGDQRSLEEAGQITRDLSQTAIYQITGARMDASMPAAKIRWLKRNEPGAFQKSILFTGCKDYIRYLLTGDHFTDPVDACAMSMYDLNGRSWSPILIESAGASTSQLPVVASPVSVAGALQRDPAIQLGLKAGTPVVVGSGDDIEVLGNGLMQAGRSLEHLGTTGSILTCADHPIYDPEMALELYPHADPDLWVLGGSITSAGAALAWASCLLGYPNLEEAFSALQTNIYKDGDPPLVFLPHLHGERCPAWQPSSRGSWIGLTSSHSSQHLMQSAFQGTVFALRQIFDRIESLAGQQELLTVSAREDESEAWLQLRANIYERPLGLIQSTEPTALGAMILAAVGLNIYTDLGSAVENTARIDQILIPNQENSPSYRRDYFLYQQAQSILSSYWQVAGGTDPAAIS
jgi:xylulokinase